MQPKLKRLTKHSLSFDGIPPLEDELCNSGHHLVAISHWCPPSARKDLGFFHTTDVGEKLEAKQVWLWTDGSMPPTVQALEEVCLWFGKDEHENR